MHTMQRLVLVMTALVALLMLLFPPFHFRYPEEIVENLGYHFLFDPPSVRYANTRLTAIVHGPTLLIQYVALLIIGASLYLLAKPSERNRESRPKLEGSDLPTFKGQSLELDPAKGVRSKSAGEAREGKNSLRLIKRAGVTALAFLTSGVMIAVWSDYRAVDSTSGAIMAFAAVGLTIGAWRWSASFK